jgi:hypothetical protein
VTVATRKGDAGLADILFSRIVRSRGRCEYPGCDSRGPYDTAHIIGRGYSGTRCVEENAWCLCRTHHVLVDNWWDEKQDLIDRTIGRNVWIDLKGAANAYKTRPVTSAVFWSEELARLKARCRELGLSEKRAA